MSSVDRSKVVGAGLIALDLVVGADPKAAVRCWGVAPVAM